LQGVAGISQVPAVIRFVSSLDVTAAGKRPGTMHNVAVTGGSRGIGPAISRRIAAAGCIDAGNTP